MSNETAPRQFNMFTGELDDNRTSHQKKLDRERKKPHQIEMFSQAEIAQFGVNAHPLLPISDNTKLGLMFEDPRTEEEKQRARQRQAEKKTYPMFEESDAIAPDTKTLALVLYKAPCLALAVIKQVSSAMMLIEPVKREVMITENKN